MRGVLFVPEWPTADFWAELFDSKAELKKPFQKVTTCRPFIVQEVHDRRSPFSGHSKFNFLQITF